jgi:hypothetical protein
VRAAWLMLLALGGCRTTAPVTAGATNAALEPTTLQLEFSQPGEGVLLLVLPSRREDVVSLSWELALGGRTFAVGLEAGTQRTADGQLQVRAPLGWRHLGWREGPRFLDVQVRGVVRYRQVPELERFEGRREVLATGGPLLDITKD